MPRVVITNTGGSGGGAPSGSAGGSLAGSYPNPTIAAGAVTTTEIADGTIVSGDLNAAAGITSGQLAGSIAPSKITGTAVTAADTGTVTSAMILDGTIVTGDLSATAGITSAQLAGSIAPSKITGTAVTAADTGTVTSAMILDGTIAGADLNTASVITQLQGQVGGLPKITRRTANSGNVNSGNTGTTLTSDDTLLLAVGASDVWFVQTYLLVNAANATMDFKVGWVGPASAAFQWGALSTPASAVISWGPTGTGTAGGAIKTLAQSLSVDTTGAGIIQGMSFAGIYVGGGSAGNLTLQWAQNTSDAGNLNLQANSFIMGWRIA